MIELEGGGEKYQKDANVSGLISLVGGNILHQEETQRKSRRWTQVCVSGFLGGSMVKSPPAVRETLPSHGFDSGWGRPPGGANGKPTPVFLPGKSYGQRSLACYSPWVAKSRTQRNKRHASVGIYAAFSVPVEVPSGHLDICGWSGLGWK